MIPVTGNPNLRSRREQAGFTVYIPYRGAFWLNELAMEILQLVDSGCDEAEVLSSIMDRYVCPGVEVVRDDIQKAIVTLQKIEALVPRL